MSFNDLLGDGQAQSRSSGLGPPCPMEGVEDPGQILFFQFLEGVCDAYLQKTLLRRRLNDNITPGRRKLGGIVKDV